MVKKKHMIGAIDGDALRGLKSRLRCRAVVSVGDVILPEFTRSGDCENAPGRQQDAHALVFPVGDDQITMTVCDNSGWVVKLPISRCSIAVEAWFPGPGNRGNNPIRGDFPNAVFDHVCDEQVPGAVYCKA